MTVRTSSQTHGLLHAAVEELKRQDAARAAETRTARARITRLIRITDEMVGELEAANLEGVRWVSPAWRPRLELLCADLPIDVSHLGVRLSPTRVLDFVFEVQEVLFDLKRSRTVTLASGGPHWKRWARPLRVEVVVLRRPGVHRVPVRVA